MKAVGVGLLPTVLCAALASAAQAQPGEIVFASNRSPELLVLHRYSIGVDGTGRHDLGSADGLLSPNVRFAARIVDDATTSRVDVVPVAGGAALTVASFSRTDASRRQEVVDVRWSPGGRRLAIVLFVGPANVYDLWVVGADGTGLRHVSLHARTPAWSPDGRELAFVGYVDRFGRDSILIADLASGRIRVRTPGLHPAWSPRGRLIAYVAPRGLGVLDAHEPGHRILRTLPGVGPPAWSPDGERVAFVGSGRTLTTVRPDGRGLRLLAHAPTPGSMTLFAWSPDSRRLAYVATTSTYLEPSSPAPTSTFPADYQILVVGVDGRGRRQVTHENPWASFTELRFAADGRRLLYAGEQTANDRELYTIEPDGSGLRQLTDNLVDDLDPAWSPDRRAIVFEQSNENGYNPPVDAGLFTLDLTGGAGTRLTTREFGQRDVHPAWSPDGGLIAFSRVTVAQPVGFVHIMCSEHNRRVVFFAQTQHQLLHVLFGTWIQSGSWLVQQQQHR